MKKIICFVTCLLFLFGFSTRATASELPYDSYVYRFGETPLGIPAPYECERSISAKELGLENLTDLSDIYAGTDRIYLCDAGNNRIVMLKHDLSPIGVIDSFLYNGVQDTFHAPTAIVEENGMLYIADSLAGRIVELNARDLTTVKVLERPEIAILEEEFSYVPQKLAVDAAGRIYVIAEGINRGLIELDENGAFSTFLGAPSVVPDFLEQLWRRVASKAQRERLEKYVPTEYNALVMDDYGFIYAVAKNTENTPFVKLNGQGNDVLRFEEKFGDEEYADEAGLTLKPYFIDLAVDSDSLYYLLDSQQGKIYVYTGDGNQLFAFGANGSQKGTFYSASAIEIVDGHILVTDASKNLLTVYCSTVFGQKVTDAVKAQEEGRTEEARILWGEVQHLCSHYPMATIGLAQLDMTAGREREAMAALKSIGAVEQYDEAFSEYRSNFLRRYMLPVLAGFVAAAVLVIVLVRVIKKTKWFARLCSSAFYREYTYGSYCIRHPFDGFWDLKREKRGSLRGALLTLVLFTVCYAVRAQFSGYYILGTDSSRINALQKVLMFLLPLLLFVISNWCFTTLMDGEGTFRDIVIFTCYSLKPYLITFFPLFLFSHVLTSAEAPIYTLFDTVTLLWMLVLLFVGMMMTHDYTLSKTVLTAVCTAVGMALLLFIALLLLNVVRDVAEFFKSLYNEIAFRAY